MTYVGANHVYCVSYDLKAPGRNYSSLFKALEQSGKWWHFLRSTWLINTPETAAQLWNRLATHIDRGDYLLIIEVRGEFYGWLPEDAWDWIRENVP